MNPCPLCGAPLASYRDRLDGWCVLEEGEHCLAGHYTSTSSHGNHELQIGEKVWGWNYLTPLEEQGRIGEEANREIISYRRQAHQAAAPHP